MMDWLGRKLYPNARPYERRSRMEVIYILAVVLAVVVAAVVIGLVLLYWRPRR